MIDYTADDVRADNLGAVLAAAAREHPVTIDVERSADYSTISGADIRYRVAVSGVSVRGILAMDKATAEGADPKAQPDLLHLEQQP